MGMPNDLIICLLILCILLGSGVLPAKSFSKQQSILTLKTDKGQVYECVKFYNQRAFNHPLIKNNNYTTQKVKLNTSPSNLEKSSGLGLKGRGCPFGTVPILKYSDNNVVITPHDVAPPSHCTAVVRTKGSAKFLGSDASISLYKPKVEPTQWSSSRIKLSSGTDSIEAGWMVNPALFNDQESHLYAKFTSGSSGCINTQCAGFVQVAKDIPLGLVPENYSSMKGDKFTWILTIEKHQDDGNWWLAITGDSKFDVGYWPKSLFHEMADFAAQVEWGGETGNPGGKDPPPEMGSGNLARFDTSKIAFFQKVTVIDESSHNVNPQSTENHLDCFPKYNVADFGYKDDYWGRLIL